ncbi:nitrate/nitrite two-component system sensor histidine kinase NarQ [Pasteurella bettyae]|uniref:Sensor protein n=1 Tax=Pasteurella bettyae CCUG 2042 TaxID=1095749 RepID=I3DBL2_9PAST|nr:nitrate/nitrite two-component system sensor histidine kinase NarQ [Pasteurella bettyae]EIJ69105.1 nitrate/nitrite sensor protein NarQ [Pasteurella bettyae CCUG 2042]SUB22833.1 sensor protein NarQ [Pasteurella bettyae]
MKDLIRKVKIKKKSVTTRIAHYLLLIITLAGVITSFSFAIMQSNESDAELINVAGSLRMQSYRLIYTMEYEPEKLDLGLRQYRVSLHSNSLVNIRHSILTPTEVKQAYSNLVRRWQEMETYAQQNKQQAYRSQITSYVDQVDQFVLALQKFAEKKVMFAVLIFIISMLLIVILASYLIWYTNKEIVYPLNRLIRASIQVEMRQFNHIPLDINKNDELGRLAKSFTHMSAELNKLYSNLEEKVTEKTQKLNQINRSLAMLYHCSQELSTNDINRNKLLQVLKHVMGTEHLRAFELDLIESSQWNIKLGEASMTQSWQEQTIGSEGNKLGVLRWQAGLPCPDPRGMENIAQLLGRALYLNQNQRQQQQLLLMEERSIIARELHDSLAQVLSFLQIQLTLLKHNLHKNEPESKQISLNIIKEFEQALSDGYIQLRELLATFRLTVQEANLQLALEQVIDSLRNQTNIQMTVDCTLPSQTFTPQQLIHALQIVREATLNAIKHSKASLIEIIAHVNQDGEQELLVRDNGIGIPSLNEPDGHYGLNIMQERSQQLNARLSIHNRDTGGTEVKIILSNTLS